MSGILNEEYTYEQINLIFYICNRETHRNRHFMILLDGSSKLNANVTEAGNKILSFVLK